MYVLSTYLFGIIVVLCGTLVASQRKKMLTELAGDMSERRVQGYPYDNREKRALISLGLSAAKSLLDGAKFLYSNGFDSVYVKRGGIRKALKDFNSVVDRQHVNFFRKSENTVKKVGKVGDVTITLYNESGTAIIIIAKMNNKRMSRTDPLTLDSVIVYKGR